MKPEFVLAFRLKGEESFEALLKLIFAKKISGARYQHRSFINFSISFALSLILSSLIGLRVWWFRQLSWVCSP